MVEEVTVKLEMGMLDKSVSRFWKFAPLGFLAVGIYLKNKRRRMPDRKLDSKDAVEPECAKKSICFKISCHPTWCCGLVCLGCTVGFVTLTSIIMAYMISVENANMSKARSTLSYFNLDSVCALDSLTEVYSTFENRKSALAANQTIMHCGPCGQCSNSHDIDVYHETA